MLLPLYIRKKFRWGVLLPACLLLAHCVSSGLPEGEPQINTSPYYYATGMRFYEAGRLEQAQEEYRLALKLNPQYGPAYYGLGLLQAKKGDFTQALRHMERAKQLDGIWAHVGMIRLYTLQKGDKWLEKAGKEFEEGTRLDPSNPSLHFYMGIAYKEAYQFDQAEALFSKVRGSPSAYSAKAEKERENLYRLRQANPQTPLGRELALREKITRAELAAFLVEELADAPYCPETAKNLKLLVTDIENHPLKKYIEQIIPCNLPGLDVSPALLFEPDRPVTRMEMALLAANLRTRLFKKNEIILAHGGKVRSYTDVSPLHYAYHSIIIVTALGLMGPAESGRREFHPQAYIGGSEAVLILKTLQQQLKS